MHYSSSLKALPNSTSTIDALTSVAEYRNNLTQALYALARSGELYENLAYVITLTTSGQQPYRNFTKTEASEKLAQIFAQNNTVLLHRGYDEATISQQQQRAYRSVIYGLFSDQEHLLA